MKNNPEHTWGHTIAFGEAYYQRATQLLQKIRQDTAIMAEVAARCVDALRAGHKVYANITTGHMPGEELANDREGNPAPFEFSGADSCSPEQFEAMQEGDVLLTNQVGDPVLQARQVGVYVVVFTTAYVTHCDTPAGQVHPNPNNWMPEDVASRVVDSHIPWEQGLVHIPEVPEMAVFPGSGIGSCTIHWMITAEVSHALATGTTPDGQIGRQYADILLERLEQIHIQDIDQINEVAEKIAKRIIDGGYYFLRSRNGGVQSEANGVAQGLMLCNGFEPRPAAEGGDKDIFLIAAVSADDPQDLQWADEARANGNYIIGIGPSDNDSLRQRCDDYFDDRCGEKAGVIAIPGRDDQVCPATGILNNIIAYTLTAQFVDEMCRRGAVPYFYMGFYRLLGTDYNNVLRPFFAARGY
jgi:uncharacterized phosphosugar-binding protein